MNESVKSQPINLKFKRYYHDIAPLFKKQKTRASTAAVFSFLAISLFLWYAVKPTAQTIIYLRREISDKTALNKQMEEKITSLIEAQSTYEAIQDRLYLLEDALPKNPDAVLLAKQLRNIAAVSQASISALSMPSVPLLANESTPGARLAPIAKPLQDFSFTLIISGPYESIKSFLSSILTLTRITSFETISVRQITGNNIASNTLQVSIRLKSYYSQQ